MIKNLISCLLIIVLFVTKTIITKGQVNQFPQVYNNYMGSGSASNLNIRDGAGQAGTSILTLFPIGSKIGAVGITTHPTDAFKNWVQVCLPSINGTLTYGYIACNEFYARIDPTNNYATVNASSLNIRPSAGSSAFVTINGSNASYGNSSIVALTGVTTIINPYTWYEVYLPMNCSQSKGWLRGDFLILPTSQNYYTIAGRVCDNTANCNVMGNVNAATITFGSIGSTFSSSDFYQYKLPAGWNGSITCTHPNYTTSSPTSYNHTAANHNYTRNFILSNAASCTSPIATVNDVSGFPSVTLSCLTSGGSGGTVNYKWYSGTSCSGTVLSTNSTFNTSASGNYACKAYINGFESTCFSCDFGLANITPTTYTISGNVKDVAVNNQTKSIDLSDYPGCNVIAYNAGTNIIAGSTVSDNSGYFEISLLSPGNYDINATDNTLPANSVKVFNVTTNSFIGDLRIPATLLAQIENAKNQLINLNPTISSLGTTILTFDYNISSQNSLSNQWKSVQSNHDDVIESAARLYIADNFLHRYYLNADKLNNEIATDIFELLKSAWSLINLFDKTEQFLSNTSLDFMIGLVNSLRDVIIDKFIIAIENSLSLLPPDKYYLRVAIKTQIELLKLNPELSSNLSFTVLEPVIENLAANYMIGHEYIQMTQPSMDLADLNASSLSYSGSFNSHYVQANQMSIQAEVAADNAQINSELHRDISNIIGQNSDLFNAASNGLGALGIVQFAGILRGLAYAGDFWSYRELARSFKYAINGFYSNIENLQPNIDAVYRNKNSNYIQQLSLTQLDSAALNYNSLLNLINSLLLIDNNDSIYFLLDDLITSNEQFHLSIKNAFIPINSSAYQVSSIIPDYDSILHVTFIHTLEVQPAINFKLSTALIAYLIDTTSVGQKDSLYNYISILTLTNLNIRNEFDSIYTLISGLPSFNYIKNITSNIPNVIEKGTISTCKVHFTNLGPTDCSDLYAILYIDSPFVSNMDSIYIGNLLEGAIDSLEFSITAANSDTTVGYRLLFFGTNTVSEGFIGAIKSRDLPSSPTLSYDSLICLGDTLRLYSNTISNRVRYRWAGPNGFESPLQNPVIPNLSFSDLGIYTCHVISDGLNSTQSLLDVSINIPVPTIQGDLNLCTGDSTILSTNQVFYNHVWSTGDTTTSIVVTNPGNYTITVTNENGCQGSETVHITVNSLPTPIITGTDTICDGASSILDAGIGFVYYQWSTTDTTQTVFVTNNGIYFVVVTDSNDCIGSDTLLLTVNPLPNPLITGNDTICYEDSTTLDAGSGWTSYSWSTADTSQIISVALPGMYSVSVTDVNGCSNSVSINITLTSVDTSVTQSGGTLTATASPATYQWIYCDSIAITDSTNQSISVVQDGSYSVIITQNGCTDTSNCFVINVTGVLESTQSRIIIYPNPTNDILNVEMKAHSDENISISLNSILGQTILINEIQNTGGNIHSQMNLEKLSKGLYFLIISSNNTQQSFLVQKQ